MCITVTVIVSILEHLSYVGMPTLYYVESKLGTFKGRGML